MTDSTIDHALRATWQGVAKLYNEEALKYGATMAVAFALLNIVINIFSFIKALHALAVLTVSG